MTETKRSGVNLLNTSIEYDVVNSEEATEPRIDVDISGVTVVTPQRSDVSPESLLKENAEWVINKKEEYDKYREQAPERDFCVGETWQYLGDDYQVEIDDRPSSVVEDDALVLAEHHVKETSIKRGLETLYRRKARETFEDRAETYAEKMNLEYEQIEIRNQRTKWGSCSTTGTLGLNWRLMMAPIEIIDYIIIHELAHLREPNHNSSFWSLVAEFDPEYESHANWLNENSVQLIFTEEDL